MEPLPTPCVARGRLSESFVLTWAGCAGEEDAKEGKSSEAARLGGREGGGLLILFLEDGVVFISAELRLGRGHGPL